MENLNKQQIILLTLLVSFVTSIATGIVTVSLLDQAPAGVTQTINHVVERTIEKVVPSQNQTASVITKETVVVKADDLAVSAIDKTSKSVVRVKAILRSIDGSSPVFIGLGFLVTKDGLIVADKNTVPAEADFTGTFFDGKTLPLIKITTDENSRVALFRAVPITSDKKNIFVPVELGDSDALKLGQTVVGIGGESNLAVSTGIVSSLVEREKTPTTAGNLGDNTGSTTPLAPVKFLYGIETNLSLKEDTTGGPLLTLLGDVVGMKVNQYGVISYVPSNLIKTLIDSVVNKATPSPKNTI